MPMTKAYKELLSGTEPLPDHLVIGSGCKRNHGIDGKMVRYKKSGACVLCRQIAQRKTKAKKFRNISALMEYELRHENDGIEKDLW